MDVIDVDRLLREKPPDEAREKHVLRVPDSDLGTALQYQAEKDVAPLVMKDAVLALLEESRAQTERKRGMLWLTVVNAVVAAIASIAAIGSIALYVAS